jgi:uroporphyrin-III C-methyltransferase
MLVDAALAGKRVVRLKGGDPFVFGRGAEELIACREAGVEATVIPGVTSAIAVPAAAGIPVTLRGVNHTVTIVSGHAPLSAEEHASLAGLSGTIVVLMGVMTLPTLTQGLIAAGMARDTPVGIVERGYRSDQRVTFADLGSTINVVSAAGVTSPAVVVIGDVVRFARDGADAASRLLAVAASVA